LINLVLMLAFCMAVALFAVQNTTRVPLRFLWWHTDSFSLAILVIVSTAVGVILSFFMSIPVHTRRRRQLKQKERELSELKDAITKH
jgi:uncharacterized integral membrane protein